MFDCELCFNVVGFIHSEVFEVLLKEEVLLRGSLQIDLGGRTIPLIIFCQEESSSEGCFSGSVGAPVLGV